MHQSFREICREAGKFHAVMNPLPCRAKDMALFGAIKPVFHSVWL